MSLQDIANSIATQFGIPTGIFSSLIGKESGGGPGSDSSTWNPNAVGAAGEIGLGQLLPSTASMLGVTNPYDPTQNLTGAATYLSQMFARFGNWQDALAAYNAGPGGYQSAQAQGYASSILAASGPTGTQSAGANLPNGGAATGATPSKGSSVLLYGGAVLVVIVLVVFGIWGVVKSPSFA